jgi:hypothetical protein
MSVPASLLGATQSRAQERPDGPPRRRGANPSNARPAKSRPELAGDELDPMAATSSGERPIPRRSSRSSTACLRSLPRSERRNLRASARETWSVAPISSPWLPRMEISRSPQRERKASRWMVPSRSSSTCIRLAGHSRRNSSGTIRAESSSPSRTAHYTVPLATLRVSGSPKFCRPCMYRPQDGGPWTSISTTTISDGMNSP